MEEPKGYSSRGHLPHWDAGQVPQFVTWRLADSLPAHLYREWKLELNPAADPAGRRELYRRAETHLDEGFGSQLLRDSRAAQAVQQTLLFDHGRRYDLIAFCVMPTHVHLVMTPGQGVPLSRIVQILKSQSSRKIGLALGRQGQVWQEDYFDRLIRDDRHLAKVIEYVEWNPVKAGLCTDPSLWPWSSASQPGGRLLSPGL